MNMTHPQNDKYDGYCARCFIYHLLWSSEKLVQFQIILWICQKYIISFLPTIKYILMDNISFHKSVQIRTLLKSHQLIPIFIPPYSPSFDPIEEFFSVIIITKHILELKSHWNDYTYITYKHYQNSWFLDELFIFWKTMLILPIYYLFFLYSFHAKHTI